MSPKLAMISVMANVIGSSNAYDDDRLNDPAVWSRFMQRVLDEMETCPDDAMRSVLEGIDREQFQQWIDSPDFWKEINLELERRAQVLMTLLPSETQGHC